MNTHRAYITKALRNADRRPFNITKLPLVAAAELRAMIAEGAVVTETVTKPSRTRPGQTVTHTYARLSS